MRKLLAIFGLLVATSCAQTRANYPSQVLAEHPSAYINFNEASASAITDHVSGSVFTPNGTITAHTAGYDTTSLGNFSTTFASGASLTAPNTALGNLEWSSPWSVQVQVNNLNISRSGDYFLPFLQKGTVSYNAQGWAVGVSYNAAGTQFCIMTSASGTVRSVFHDYCTEQSGGMDFPNGYNYNIVFTYAGTGNSASDYQIYVNGLPITTVLTIDQNNGDFGAVGITASGGTGYADSTPLTVTGGGPKCHVTGNLISSSGVPQSVSLTSSYGCTSTPSVSLTGATGTGVTLTPTVNITTMSNSGHLTVWGGAQSAVLDEAAIFPSVVSQALIQGTFVHTKWYEQMVFAKPAEPPYVFYSNDGCEDSDNIFSLQIAIGAHLQGYIRLVGVSSDDALGDLQGAKMYRMMLDAAGLHHVPVTGPSVPFGGDTAHCSPMFSTYNASVKTTFPNDVTTLRTILAGLPTGKKLVFLFGGPNRILKDLMESPADGISALTGSQLFAQKVDHSNAQGLGCYSFPCSAGLTNESQDAVAATYVFANNGSVPLNYFPGIPEAAGPGTKDTHAATDPMTLMILATPVLETRTCFDCLPTVNFLTTAFQAGTSRCGTITVDPSAHTLSGVASPDSHHCIFDPATSTTTGLYKGVLWRWFLNSLVNVRPQGPPRSF